MAIAHEYEYFAPASLFEATQILSQFGKKAAPLAGGTDLIVFIKEGMITPAAVIDLKRVKDLKALEIKAEGLFLGANTTFSDLVNSQIIKREYRLLWESAHSVASVGIRNRATVVGNICSAIPSMDAAPALLCYDAVVHLISLGSEREVPIQQWFVAPRKTLRKPDEIVAGISLKKPADKHAGIYLKLGRYKGEDLAQAGLGILVTEKWEYRLAFCAVAPIPARASSIEGLLFGKKLNPELILQVQNLIPTEIAPINDIRSSARYRTHICKVMMQRGLPAAVDRLNGVEIDNTGILGG
ncbi:MAG: FAD binding domain-containing protein [Candidatus Cloacimonadaceae bacterium]|nr:FAD binding domain-containing protein [Candidatus Cloacimonadaceae bacterium]MDP3113785.1 FAD binding domain-containing protein [Candidatus Cloacimonadaceae bacterium]